MPDTPSPLPWAGYTSPSNAGDLRNANEQAFFTRKLATDDAARAAAGMTTVVAIAGFTIVDDPETPEGRVVNYGDELQVSMFDLPRYAGRVMLK